MPIYNKLVRDRIPEVIAADGKKFSTSILSNEEFIKELAIVFGWTKEICEYRLNYHFEIKGKRPQMN